MFAVRTFSMVLALAATIVLMPSSLSAGAGARGLTLVSAVSAAGGFSLDLPRSVAQPVSYCRRDCEACRSYCYNTYRVYCYDYSCRQAFSQCMKDCWNNICRQCGY